MTRTTAFILTLLIACIPLLDAEAQNWHQWRGDSGRTATVGSGLDIETPGIRWKSPAGGLLSNDFIYDVDGDALDDVLTVEGGRVVARGVNGNLLWDTPNLLGKRIEGVVDLDGDGSLELLLRRTSSFAVLTLTTGALIWESQVEEPLESLASFRVTDVQGDGFYEVLIADQAMNAGKPYLTGQVHLYSFENGFENPFPQVSTELDTRDYEVGRSVITADITGDGIEEIVVTGKRAIYVYSSLSGELIAGSDPESFPEEVFLGVADLFAEDLDGDGGLEVVAMLDTDFVGNATREAAVFEYAEKEGWVCAGGGRLGTRRQEPIGGRTLPSSRTRLARQT